MRLTSDLFVSALLRRISGSGGFGAVLRRGNREAGAILLVLRARDGSMALYGPAPQSSYGPDRSDTRCFTRIEAEIAADALERRIEREAQFDPDLWAVEIELGALPLSEMVTLIDD